MEASTSGVKDYLITDEPVLLEDSTGIKDYLITDKTVSPENGRSSEQRHSWLGHLQGYYDFLPTDASNIYPTTNSSDLNSSKDSSIVKSSKCSAIVESSHSTVRSSKSWGNTGSATDARMSEFMKDWVEDTSSKVGIPDPDDLAYIEGYKAPKSVRSKSLSDLNPFRVSHLVIQEYTWKRVMAITRDKEITVGHGSFGVVYKGTLENKTHVAVKILAATSKQGDLEFYNEVELLSKLNHINLVKLLGCCQENRKRVLVYEYAEEGCLYEYLHGGRPSLDWKTRLRIALDSARGIEYLHFGCTPRIIHRDIKSRNILVAKGSVAKVADFGLSKLTGEGDNSDQSEFITDVKGTPGYLDPEYCRTNTLNHNSDIYSFGVVLLEIATGKKPTVDAAHISEWVKAQMKSAGVIKVIDPKLGNEYNIKSAKTVINLALSCLHQCSKNRPDIREVVKRLGAAADEASKNPKKNIWFKRA
ncbi:probable LRR receptor-like serine/threonine-protein kinase At4g20450 [Physcomitrium patens]|uniref:Protein kinase domain-containing protein n=1 Tax=Physcomitrium patens TaxID=3218 RepID=A0A2K1JKU4_PHYPA|nr:probable LRR receptor-like serine/threonine-protein kinase At4g20450 [Physcomitrium patens]PNR42161.1 hypothetical protein PHYPA_016990 [Physcomitrium patens]|eukprot:XP_024392119.1 probable LRR receptor-like serine/threonine-protein kinase At4g20450 [Physcomitrella patens]